MISRHSIENDASIFHPELLGSVSPCVFAVCFQIASGGQWQPPLSHQDFD
jgi:hypothetical protein